MTQKYAQFNVKIVLPIDDDSQVQEMYDYTEECLLSGFPRQRTGPCFFLSKLAVITTLDLRNPASGEVVSFQDKLQIGDLETPLPPEVVRYLSGK